MSENIKCVKCEAEKKKGNYYKSPSPLHNGNIPYCKPCIRSLVDTSDIESVKNTLRMIDRPFINHLWDSSMEESINNNRELFGVYMKNVGMSQYRSLTWKDSILGDRNNIKPESGTAEEIKPSNHAQYDLESLKEKYGYGYPDNEYLLFEKKFQQLRPSFQLVTTMHEECLREYCVNKVKETLAKARGDFKEAKDWASMAKDTAEAGKLKPSQMSKADLSQGLDGFGQLARMVEEKIEMQQVLPKFISRPKDNVDVTLWLYINYIRDLKGLPEAEYKEIWDFYNARYEDYMSQSLDYGSEGNE